MKKLKNFINRYPAGSSSFIVAVAAYGSMLARADFYFDKPSIVTYTLASIPFIWYVSTKLVQKIGKLPAENQM